METSTLLFFSSIMVKNEILQEDRKLSKPSYDFYETLMLERLDNV